MMYVGEYEVDLQRHEVRNGSGALNGLAPQILIALARARGELVSKQALCEQLWDSKDIDDNRLQVHISTLRKMLGADRDAIRTVAGRGYRLLATRESQRRIVSTAPSFALSSSATPPCSSGLFGRSAALAELGGRLKPGTIITLTGLAGMGKSCLAQALAKTRATQFRDGCYSADLKGAVTPFQVIERLLNGIAAGGPASQRNAAIDSEADTVSQLHAVLQDKQALCVLDNSDTALTAVASLVDSLRTAHPHLTFLLTSREALHIPGEQLYRTPPLPTAPDHNGAEALALFNACAPGAPRNCPAWTAATIELCRRLDGLPLAIEMAARQSERYGIAALLSQSDKALLNMSMPCAARSGWPLTLRETLESSCAMLSQELRRGLGTLAHYKRPFTFEEAHAVLHPKSRRVAANSFADCSSTANLLVELVLKSMLISSHQQGATLYRMLAPLRWLFRETPPGKTAVSQRRRMAGRQQVFFEKRQESAHF